MSRLKLIKLLNSTYRSVIKPVLFKFDAEYVHEHMTRTGSLFGHSALIRSLFSALTKHDHAMIEQTVSGIRFRSPVGLAAGFDYQAELPFILPSLGFGFGTIGSITRYPYQGNPRPRLGRLPKSRALLVNKGFKNPGCRIVIEKLEDKAFSYPVGISIGRTNTASFTTLVDAINDVSASFSFFEESYMKHAYYELNISCPNLMVDISFYEPESLAKLLRTVTNQKLKRPVFIKMPIDKTNEEFTSMLDVIMEFPIAGIIIGNLQKKRDDPSLVPEEVAKFKMGNFSGKPTWNRSNELINLAYRHAGKHLTIIGCGGVFSTEDAYEKIKLGASLIQLITGMIYEGPFLLAQIHMELPALLKRDGYAHLSEAVGSKSIL